MTAHGLGALQSPPDERDYQLALDASLSLPATFTVKQLAPVYDQGNTPQCVAYSAAGEQQSFDLADQGHTYLWDFGYFFHRIGGTSNGAVIRNAFQQRLTYGYPLRPAGSGNSHAAHRIAAYYAVNRTQASVKTALVQYGTLVLGTPWFNSWFEPSAGGALLPADYQVGGHAITVVGYDSVGLWLRNSWGADWGKGGECRMSWSQFAACAWEVWKAVDVIDKQP